MLCQLNYTSSLIVTTVYHTLAVLSTLVLTFDFIVSVHFALWPGHEEHPIRADGVESLLVRGAPIHKLRT